MIEALEAQIDIGFGLCAIAIMKLRSTYICALLVFLAMIPAPALAAPPASPYMPGETLDPSCAPGSSNCTVTSTQSVANGGTGWTNIVSGTILYGNGSSALATTSAGTAGNVLALLGGVPTWTATTTFSTGLAYMSGNVTLNTANANTWTALQQFSNASTTLFSAYGPAYFGSSATSSFSSTGTLTLASALTVGNGGTGATSFGQGWLFSSGDGAALSASTSPTVNYITATSTTATSTFANGVNITGGCFARNGVCIATGSGSDLQHAALYDTNEAMTNIPTGGAQTTLGTVSVTPTSVTGDVYVTGWVDAYSGDVTDQPLELVIETTNNCTGSTVGNASVTYTITTGASTANVRGTIRVSGIAVDPGASAQPYSLCAAITSGGGDSDIMNWGIEALVIDTGADVAEIYTTRDAALEAGDVVSIDPALNAGVHKSQSAHDQNAIGIISTRPGMLIGGAEKEGVKAVPVALSGRVPVKVVTENGAVKPGDYLTPSSVPGVAMKTQGRGHVIGQAIGAFDGEGVGIVVAFIKNFDLDEGALRMGDISSSSTDLNVIQSESAHDPIAILAKKITDGA